MEDLKQLAHYLMYDKDGNARTTSELADSEEFKALSGNPDQFKKSWKLIVGDLQHFGGDTLVNVFRGNGVLYKEILSDVCDKLNVKYDGKNSAYDIENNLIEKLTKLSWEEMSSDEKDVLFDLMKIDLYNLSDSEILNDILNKIDKNKEISFIISSWLSSSSAYAFGGAALGGLVIANLGRRAATDFFVSRSAALLSGVLAIFLTVPLITGTAYRVTVPAAIQIAYMRRKYEQENRFK